jgi:branched-chain amino acid transport system ATP-binding protein
MLAIGRALVPSPELLIMDEPSEGLAPSVLRRIESEIVTLRGSAQSVLLVEQNFGVAGAVADRLCILDDGIIVFDNVPSVLDSSTIDRYLAV